MSLSSSCHATAGGSKCFSIPTPLSIAFAPAECGGERLRSAKSIYAQLSFEAGDSVSDQRDVTLASRKITYSVPDSENLTISVNGVRIFCKGGNWGLDEAMKRIPRERLEAQIACQPDRSLHDHPQLGWARAPARTFTSYAINTVAPVEMDNFSSLIQAMAQTD